MDKIRHYAGVAREQALAATLRRAVVASAPITSKRSTGMDETSVEQPAETGQG